MWFIGVKSLPIVLFTVFFSGAVLALHTARLASRFGGSSLIGGVIANSLAVELAPVLSAVVVAARSGSAIAAELGTMKVTEQIDAMRAMGVSPLRFLVAPRLASLLVMMPVLALYAGLVGWLGGMLVASLHNVSPASFINSTRQLLDPNDVVRGLAKTICFGAIIAVVGCSEGLGAKQGAAGVGAATTRAVVASVVLIYISNYFLSAVLFAKSVGIQ
jgi:phospholipid/cholesterol/gamma-HCH transport system permease protein